MGKFVFVEYEGDDSAEALGFMLLGVTAEPEERVEVREYRAQTPFGFQPNPLEQEEDDTEEDEDDEHPD